LRPHARSLRPGAGRRRRRHRHGAGRAMARRGPQPGSLRHRRRPARPPRRRRSPERRKPRTGMDRRVADRGAARQPLARPKGVRSLPLQRERGGAGGFAFAAVAAYLRDEQALRRAWDAFRTFACDPDAPDRENIDPARPVRDGWTHDDREPCAIDPAGARGRVPPGRTGAGTIRRLDGALVGDMRGGGTYPWKPGYPQDVWLGLEGFIPAAVILDRAGYPAFEMANLSVLRTHEVLWHLRSKTGDERWFDGDRAREIVQCELDPPALTSRHERSSAAVEARLRSGGGSCRAPSGRRGRRGARQRRAAWPPMDSGRTTCRRPSEGARGARGTRSRGSLPCSTRHDGS